MEKNKNKLIESYRGGDIYQVLLFNEVSPIMTHVENFSFDRLAIFLLENVFEFISSWTNLQFYYPPPLQTIEKYFELNPDHREPIWTVSLNFFFTYTIFLI